MRSLQEKLKTVRDVLLTTSIKEDLVFHYERPKNKPVHWIVWQEDGEMDSFNANDRKKEQQGRGYIDCFTQIEYDPLLDEIQEALDAASNIGWTLDSVQYEEETKLIHYQWTFRVV